MDRLDKNIFMCDYSEYFDRALLYHFSVKMVAYKKRETGINNLDELS